MILITWIVAGAILVDALLLCRDRWRRRGVIATGSTPALAAQNVVEVRR